MNPATDTLVAERPSGDADDATSTALQFIHGLLQTAAGEARPLPALLADLARAFAARGAGLAAPPEGSPLVRQHVRVDGSSSAPAFPWENQPHLLAQIRQSVDGVSAQAADGSTCLLAAVWPPTGGGWLLWLEAPAGRVWSGGERAALPLAGQALARLTATTEGRAAGWPRPLERARIQQHLESAAKITSRLAHDFGNVLTGILGFAELTLNHLPTDSLPHRYVKEVWESAQQGARWVQQLHLFSRRRFGEFPPVAIQTVVGEEEARVRPTWAPNVALHVALQPELPTVAVEAGALRQVLAQILDNAREAIAGQGIVTITARLTDLSEADCQEMLGGAMPGPHIEVTVTDTGAGLTPEARQRLFADLFHSNKVRHRGLGLAMVYGVLQAARGGLRFGPDPAQGTAVRLFLPVAGLPVPKQAPIREGKQRVLVVDDDPLILRFIATILEGVGYRVQVAAGGAEALALYTTAAEPFRLVLSDVVMPSMNGVELAQRLRQHDPGVNLLFVSSEVPAAPQVEGLIQPGFLAKPFRADMLVQAVGSALERGRSTAPVGQTA